MLIHHSVSSGPSLLFSSLRTVTICVKIVKDEDVLRDHSFKFRTGDAEQCFCEANIDILRELPNEQDDSWL
jgi:hypothetical protein